jgi:hypothetical protein
VIELIYIFNFAEFDLETLRSRLDEKGLAIAESQETSMKSRKQLSEKTKGTKLQIPLSPFSTARTHQHFFSQFPPF